MGCSFSVLLTQLSVARHQEARRCSAGRFVLQWPGMPRICSAGQSGLGNGPVALSQAHAMDHLAILVHVDSPLGHDSTSRASGLPGDYQIFGSGQRCFGAMTTNPL